MSAYIVARVKVDKWDTYKEYMLRTPRIVKKYGGRIIARGAAPETLEGKKEEKRIVLMEFPSADGAKAFYNSIEYTNVRKIRENAADAQFILIEEYPITEWNTAVEASENLFQRTDN